MLKIEITDPHLMDKKSLVATATYLMQLAGHEIVKAPSTPTEAPSKAPEASSKHHVVTSAPEFKPKNKVKKVEESITKPVIPEAPPVSVAPIATAPVPPAPVVEQPAKEETFADIMSVITAAISSGKITMKRILEMVKNLGCESVANLSTRPELIPLVSLEIKAEVGL